MQNVLLPSLIIVNCFSTSAGFNIDVESAIKIKGPDGSYFGFSSAIKRNAW